jgi:selenocysteine lyase/cysteine desulfurase
LKDITLTVNGITRQLVVDEKRVLLDLLRQDLHLTGAKQSCDRKGQCGGCTVIVNGQAFRSCLTKVADLEGADIITIDGLGTPENPHDVAEAIRPTTTMVILNHASNVIGTIQDAEGIGQVCQERDVPLILDVAQSAGLVSIPMGEWGVSALAFTGHKSLLGPTGICGLVFSSDLDI